MATNPLPHRPPVEPVDGGTRTVELGTEEMATLCTALGSETAREVLALLDEEPRTASDVADDVDTSLQNVLYHLRRLREADLVTVVDTWYSSRGSEMKVYDTAQSRLVLASPGESTPESEPASDSAAPAERGWGEPVGEAESDPVSDGDGDRERDAVAEEPRAAIPGAR